MSNQAVELSWRDLRRGLDRMADATEDWQGIPVPMEDFPVTLHSRHPLAEAYRKIDGVTLGVVVGGPDGVPEDEHIVNYWVNPAHNYEVYVLHGGGRAYAVKLWLAPSMDRLKYWVNTLGASDAWDLKAETKAREKLKGLLSLRQRRHLALTGTFLEHSPRSDLHYLFRRSRPTIVLSSRWPDGAHPDSMRCIAALCMHPVGYYQQTWAGCMVPTDDLIAHLLMMRADEAGYWRQANQHAPWRPEAGL